MQKTYKRIEIHIGAKEREPIGIFLGGLQEPDFGKVCQILF